MAVLPEVSQVGGNTPHRDHHMRQITLIHFEYSGSVRLLRSPVVPGGVGGLAGSSADAVGVVTRATDSSFDMAGVVIRVADMFSDTEGATVKAAGPSVDRGLMGSGWVATSTSAPGNLYIRPTKTSWSLKVVYLFMCCLNSCTHITKWWGSLGTGRLAFSAQY